MTSDSKSALCRTPFRKILIANRGEVALRIIRTAKSLGYATVAVYSDADASAMHVTMADEAIRVGGSAPTDSYLCIDRVVAAARASGADAVHPGYGFLAENADFAEACAAGGVVFVGPSATAIRIMGDKSRAKATMAAAGVPCIPGYQGEDQSGERLAAEARSLGFPLMIKATAGGGGRGMRLVRSADEFSHALSSAKSEARNAFGDDTVLLERAIVAPRHIEIQIMVDRYGHAIHLGERDCSVQRRHQKVVEEAPSPAVSPELRARMGEAAIAAVSAIGYEGAGTLEFLLDRDDQFYFMEMNTRLQVEHPVTEAITGLDLVELQLRIATGEPLALTQQDVEFRGHAIEVRLCAEDPTDDFLPQSGTMEIWRPSAHLRVEHALADGGVVPQFYDSMVAKLIAHGRTRDDAQQRLISGLNETVALGIRTNQAFLAATLAHSDFRAGKITTEFIERHRDSLLAGILSAQSRAVLHVAALMRATSTALVHGFIAPLRIACGTSVHDVAVRADANGRTVADNGTETLELTVVGRKSGRIDYLVSESRFTAWLHVVGGQIFAHIDGQPWIFEDRSLAPIASSAARNETRVHAAMNGKIVSVDVGVGERVALGQRAVVLEAMKMEHTHRIGTDGIVSAVHVAVGDQVTAHRVLVEVEPMQAIPPSQS